MDTVCGAPACRRPRLPPCVFTCVLGERKSPLDFEIVAQDNARRPNTLSSRAKENIKKQQQSSCQQREAFAFVFLLEVRAVISVMEGYPQGHTPARADLTSPHS